MSCDEGLSLLPHICLVVSANNGAQYVLIGKSLNIQFCAQKFVKYSLLFEQYWVVFSKN